MSGDGKKELGSGRKTRDGLSKMTPNMLVQVRAGDIERLRHFSEERLRQHAATLSFTRGLSRGGLRLLKAIRGELVRRKLS